MLLRALMVNIADPSHEVSKGVSDKGKGREVVAKIDLGSKFDIDSFDFGEL
jgi:hypothetical protein